MHRPEGLSGTDLYRGLATGKDAFLEAMSRTASGVYLVNTDGHGGRYAGTISAVASVSADPTMLLVCINKHNPLCDALEANRQFCVNAYNADQVRICRTFAGRPDTGGLPYDFESAEWLQGLTQAQRLKGAVASFDCLLHHSLLLGTHRVFIGLVVGVMCDDGEPLLYSRRSYYSSVEVGSN